MTVYFKATNECLKKGLYCPPALKCVKQGHNFVCGCDPGFKVFVEENKRKCKGISTS